MKEDLLLARIHEIDLQPILYTLVEKDEGPKWPLQKARDVEFWYRRFLYLLCFYRDELIVPTKEIDEFWHAHILDTRKYMEDCEYVAGEYIHHFPYLGERGEVDKKLLFESFQNSLALFEKHFNDHPNKEVFSAKSSICSSCNACGGGHNIHGARCADGTLVIRPTLTL